MSTNPNTTIGLSCCGIDLPGVQSDPSSTSSKFVQHQYRHIHRQQKTNGDDLMNNKGDVEALLVQGMQSLTFGELQREQEDLHGVSNELQEDDVVIDGLRQSLREHLHRIKRGTAYETAEARNLSYVTQRDFEILFLRANRYDPKAAAEQMIRFFSMKLELFGTERLVRDITLQDMDEDDMETVMCGSIQVGRCLDRSGRAIVLAIPGIRSYQSIKNDLRYQFYLIMKVLQSQESQDKGAVIVSYFVGDLKDQKRGEGFSQNIKLLLSLPLNLAGYHWCLDDPTQLIFGKMAVSLMPPRLRAKTKMHFGSHVECQYLLASYGIPREALPFSDRNNEVDLSYHKYWLKQCAQQEEVGNSQCPSERVVSKYDCVPGENDVLCIGRKASGAGNERLRNMAISFADSYDDGTVKNRKIILNRMMEKIRVHGGRFLKPDTSEEGGGGWIEVEDKEIREKIGQSFRNLRRRRTGSRNTGSAGVATAGNVSSTLVSVSSDVSAAEVLPNDILFGNNSHHTGNQRLQGLVEEMAAEYDALSRWQKIEQTSRIVFKIKGSGGRFLKPMADGRWEIVSDKAAQQKVALHFRNLRRKTRS